MSQGFIFEDFRSVVESITDDGNGVVVVDNTDPLNPIIGFNGVFTDGVTVLGNGTFANPLSAVPASSFQFPVGYVYISVDPTNPNTVLGYGTWTQFAQGRVLVGVDPTDPDFDTVEEIGGSKTHQIKCDELPACEDITDDNTDEFLLGGM